MKKIFEFVLHNRLLLLILGAIVLCAGFYSYQKLPVDAFPDVTPSLVQVFTETEGLAPEEVEKYVTYPIEVAMNGLPGLDHIRSISNFGLSVVNIYFEDRTDIYFARQLVGERLHQARDEIPQGFGEPVMGPITTGLGQVLFYILEDETGKKTLEEMRTIQDWLIKYNLQTVKGVTEVLSLGGLVKQFQVIITPDKLLRYDISLSEILHSIEANNSNVGAQFILKNAEQYLVRSVGLAHDLEDLEKIVLKSIDGTPVYLNQIADIKIGGAVRQGLATSDGKGEAVVGMVLKLIGTNTSDVIQDVKSRMIDINKTLPEGVRVVPYYDQATLVSKCIKTVIDALLIGILLVMVIIFIFMGNLRPSAVVALSIPFSLCFAFILMKMFGVSANLMSLGGLAIAIGMLVDATIVMVENVDRHLNIAHDEGAKKETILTACIEVGRPIIFAVAIIIVVFLPLFTLQGVEGKTFRPLALTVTFALLGSLVYAAFMVPVIARLVMKKTVATKKTLSENIVSKIDTFYKPLVSNFVKHRKRSVFLALGLFLGGVLIFPTLGSEFVPRLNEGDLLVRLTMAPSISLEKGKEIVTHFEKRMLEQFPEVTRVVTRLGRGEVGAHADPVNNAEAFVALKPQKEWTSAKSLDALYELMQESFEGFPGVQFNFTQPIAAAVDELLTGTKAELAVKIFGQDMEVLKAKATEVERVLSGMKGAADIQMDQITGTPQLRIQVKRDAIARYGINVEDVQEVVRVAIGGEAAGQIFEDVKRFDILVRYSEDDRTKTEDIKRILIPAPNGVKVPLGDLAAVEEIVGPRQITREAAGRFITVQCNVRGRDMGSFVREGEALIEKSVILPPGYYVKWGGQFELQQEANKRLAIVIPLTLFIVFLMLFSNFDSLKNTLLIILNIPLALVGGVIALWITGQNLSVPTSVGFIALFGIALENGMVLVTYLNQLVKEGTPIDEASIKGACLRVRPILMTALTTALGLTPLLFSAGTGSEVQRPLATVVIGGLVTSTILTLLVLPAFYKWFSDKR